MATLRNFTVKYLGNVSQYLVKPSTTFTVCCRFASKKTGSTTQNAGNARPKHRGWKRQHGQIVSAGTILVTQNSTRFHPGLNVGFGKNGNLFAMYPGKVIVTAEKIDPNWNISWNQRSYDERQDQVIYKKHYNVIPEPQHNRFKLVDLL